MAKLILVSNDNYFLAIQIISASTVVKMRWHRILFFSEDFNENSGTIQKLVAIVDLNYYNRSTIV